MYNSIGLPMFGGFISKLLFSRAAINDPNKMLPALVILAISTLLNTVYFLRTVITIYTPVHEHDQCRAFRDNPGYGIAMTFFVVLTIALGTLSQPLVDALTIGLGLFD